MSEDRADPVDPRADELDGVRIRRLAAARRAAYRARSYCIIAALACWVIAIDLAWICWRSRLLWYVPMAIVLAIVGQLFARRATALHREARRSALDEPATPPDFSTLDNGSKRWENLENVE